VTFSRTTEDGYSYRVNVNVALGKPTIDPTQADPDTTDIVLPITLEDGTLTNTTPGGHDMSTDVTETVYRHVIVPKIRGGATVMDDVFNNDQGDPDDGN
jgi:hypothetical protein